MEGEGKEDVAGRTAVTAAAEFIKYTLALGTGALVFSAGLVTDNVQLSIFAKWLLVFSWSASSCPYSLGRWRTQESPYNSRNKTTTLRTRG
jgi:hypothetical protein